MPEKLIWTALPNGLLGTGESRRLQLSVLVSPRLTAVDGADAVLGAFPDLRHWTATVADAEFALQIGDVVAADGLRPHNTLHPELWEALFTDQTPVRSHVYDDVRSKYTVVSYPCLRVEQQIRGLYASVASATSVGLPPSESGREGRDHDLLRRSLSAWGFAPSSSDTTASASVAAFRNFHDRPQRPHAPLPSTPQQLAGLLDFHQVVALLGDYPELLRRLGLVLDLDVPVGALPAASTARPLRLLPHRGPADRAGPASDISVITSTLWDGSTFTAASSEPNSQPGLLALDENRFGLVQIDVDSAVHKLTHLALNLEAIVARPSGDPPRGAGLPVLRSAGFSLVRSGRKDALDEEFSRAKTQNTVLEASQLPVLDAGQLVRGYRIDIWDSVSGEWHALCQRIGMYRFERTGMQLASIEDEGFVQLSAAGVPTEPDHPDQLPELYLHESILRWNGWSLVAPPRGLTIPTDAAPRAPEQSENAAVTTSGLKTAFIPVPGSLPSLRFGVGYRLRARVVDLAGNSPTVHEAADVPAIPAAPPGQAYFRFEPVPSPVVVLRRALKAQTDPGESLDRLVIRSTNTSPGADQVPTPEAAERHIAPPRITVALAEAHGAFDDENGKLRGDPSTYKMIRDRDGAHLGQDGTVPIASEEQLELPWLPDVLARGAALRGLPGAPSGMIGRVGDDGRLAYVAMEFPQPDSVTHIDFGPSSRWPAMLPLRLVVQDGAGPPHWDARRRVLTVELPKGEEADVPLSCFFRTADLELLGVWDWIRKELAAQTAEDPRSAVLENMGEQVLLLAQRALEGGHWALTPARTLTLVHAVQQPLGTPVIRELMAERAIGATDARLRGAVQVHPTSTGRVDLVGRWEELPGAAAFPMRPRQAEDAAAELRLPHDTVPGAVLFGGQQVAIYSPDTGVIDFHPLVHRFGDTKHRAVHYRAVATSRFSEHFVRQAQLALLGTAPTVLDPGGVSRRSETVRSADGATTFVRAEDGHGDYLMDWQAGSIARSTDSAIADGQTVQVEFLPPVNRDSEEVLVHVPSSARPAAPRVLYVVPSFEWRRQTGTNLLASHRRGHWLRVYLDGPWFSSGQGEQLGVLVSDAHDSSGSLSRYSTLVGLDPLRGPSESPSLEFPRGTQDPSGGLTLDELPPTADNRVEVYGHDVAFDANRGLWYCDIQVAVPSSVNSPTPFEPFVRLALARYQPFSVVTPGDLPEQGPRDVKLSRVVLADFAQLPADRSLLVTYDPHLPGRLRVVVSGDSYSNTRDSDGPSTVEVAVEERDAGLDGELGWLPAQGVTVTPDAPPAAPEPASLLWRGEVVLPEDRTIDEFRLVVRERDTLTADGLARSDRLLYADAVELESLATSTRPASRTDDFLSAAAALLAQSAGLAGNNQLSEAVAPARAAVDVLHEIQPPPNHEAKYLSFLADALLNLVSRLEAAGRPGEVAPFAQEATQVYRQAAHVSTGESVMQIAASLMALSALEDLVSLKAEAATAAQAAVDVLHDIQPPPGHEADYFALLAEELLNLVSRLITAGRPGEVAPFAQEATKVYRQAAHVSTGESVMQIAAFLLTLSSRVAAVSLKAEAATAAQAAVDVLHDIQPPPGHEADYFALLAQALRTVEQIH
ncbi:hypothetical protein [Kitasatospora sp. NPDC097691]|uniref:hypothetical protein n=1 Tax=Kitasatospora sp. NPDC097691 TaxID=3157231 RepID=UPI00331DFE6E